MIAEREGIDNQKTTTPVTGFVSGTKRKAGVTDLDNLERQATKLREATVGRERAVTADEGEINLDDDYEDDRYNNDEDNHNATEVTMKEVPAAVYGNLSKGQDNKSSNMGALEKLRAAAAANKGSS